MASFTIKLFANASVKLFPDKTHQFLSKFCRSNWNMKVDVKLHFWNSPTHRCTKLVQRQSFSKKMFWNSSESSFQGPGFHPWSTDVVEHTRQNKNWGFIVLYLQLHNVLRNINTNYSWNASINTHWKADSKAEISFLKYTKENGSKKNLYKIQDAYRQIEHCRVPLSKHYVPQRWWSWSESDRIPVVLAKRGCLFKKIDKIFKLTKASITERTIQFLENVLHRYIEDFGSKYFRK